MKDKSKLKSIWDKVAENFGILGPNYWNRFGERLVELSDVKKGDHVLDIGMGRGASLFPAAMSVGSTGKAVGIDLSEHMVRNTKQHILENNLDNIEVFQLDAEAVNFPDESFHNIMFGFSIGHIANNNESVKNIVRLLKENGQLSISLWGVQRDQKWLTDIVKQYLPPRKEVNKESESSGQIQLHSEDHIVDFLEGYHLRDIRVIEEDCEVVYRNKEQWWLEMWNNAVRSIFEQIEEIGEDKFQEFQYKVNKGLEAFEREKGLCFTMKVIYAYGKK